MSESENIKVSDEEALAWAAALSPEHKEELKRQALLKRAIDLAQPVQKPTDAEVAAMTDQQLSEYTRKTFGF